MQYENPATFPPVEKNTSQRYGQHWRDFFAERARNNAAKAAQEKTSKGRQARAQKEQHAARHLCPGAKGATVFVWEDVDGFRIRTAAGRKNYALIWEDYKDRERRYDPFYDEWDLCTEFGDDEEPSNGAGPSNGGGPSNGEDSSDDDSDYAEDLRWFLGSTTTDNSGLKDNGVGGTNCDEMDIGLIEKEGNDDPPVPSKTPDPPHQHEGYDLPMDMSNNALSLPISTFDPPHYHEGDRPSMDVGEAVCNEVSASHAVQKEGEHIPSVPPLDPPNPPNHHSSIDTGEQPVMAMEGNISSVLPLCIPIPSECRHTPPMHPCHAPDIPRSDEGESPFAADPPPLDNTQTPPSVSDHCHVPNTLSDCEREAPSTAGSLLSDDAQTPPGLSNRYQTLEDIAYYRFGFVSGGAVTPPDSRPAWNVVSEFLGSGRWQDVLPSSPDPPAALRESLCTFFGYVRASQRIHDIPSEIYDVRQPDSDVWTTALEVHARLEIFNGKAYYLIRPRMTGPEEAEFEIGLTSAATLLEIIRRQLGPELIEIAQYLLDKGISFNMFIRGPQVPQLPKYIPRHSGLGYRPIDYRPTALDYNVYVASRDHLLKSSRGRAALLAGGLVARLAKEVIGHDPVSCEPSGSVFEEGKCFWNGKSSSPGYWDDGLTEDELDKICGVYKVDTGQQQGDGPQTTDISWWPKPSIWETSGLFVGYWSENSERWFQLRLQKCLSGDAELRSPGAWRHAIRFTNTVRRIIDKNELLAAESVPLL